MSASADRVLPLPGDAQYLKSGIASGQQLRDPQIVDRVSEMLLDIDRNGMDAIRRYSQELDRWAPATFRASRADLDAARDAVDAGVRECLNLGLGRVRAFAELQLGTATDVEREISPGLLVGHRKIPVGRVGA